MANTELDYVNRCIEDLNNVREVIPVTSELYRVITYAIDIFKTYKNSLPDYNLPITGVQMPAPRDPYDYYE